MYNRSLNSRSAGVQTANGGPRRGDLNAYRFRPPAPLSDALHPANAGIPAGAWIAAIARSVTRLTGFSTKKRTRTLRPETQQLTSGVSTITALARGLWLSPGPLRRDRGWEQCQRPIYG
jgi:hypothetical protein